MLSIYKAEIINIEVQKALARDRPVPHGLSPDWGKIQIREIEAIARVEALMALLVCYPKELGFKVLAVDIADCEGALSLCDVFSDGKIPI